MRKTEGQLLRDFDLKKTDSRAAILRLFLNRSYALSHSDIEDEVSKEFDRVTVYRTLKTFVDKGVIHKVLDDGGPLKYALCKEACSHEHHHHEHVHFKCSKCGQTNCLDGISIPGIRLPQGYQAKEMSLLIQGTCAQCV